MASGWRVRIACGYDIEEACRFPFEEEAPFVRRDVAQSRKDRPGASDRLRSLSTVLALFPRPRRPEVEAAGRLRPLVVDTEPDVVTMENVPRLVEFKGGSVFEGFVAKLRASGYRVERTIVNCADFGVPQDRSRLVLIGSRHGDPILPEPTHAPDEHVTVSQTIGDMPPLSAGGADPRDRLHCASGMSALNFERIRASRPGGTWRDWPPELVAECHRKKKGRGYASVYGRCGGTVRRRRSRRNSTGSETDVSAAGSRTVASAMLQDRSSHLASNRPA